MIASGPTWSPESGFVPGWCHTASVLKVAASASMSPAAMAAPYCSTTSIADMLFLLDDSIR
jgi:hypothetical protein